ncbi:MAG: lipoyl synthase [Candidatus Eisenbacteria bacterium]|uniref:Lipoyl synthase n=1 Tax=Eiseniibacteriota bacterium TaxID=2212470 RepID=A0A9D6L9W8_UNCEI|nr:lipoyl synthase [Candidatus Eisenbacteria bacterium]MBI3540285.1 lipoyl synthase [Candidatus Eisenbacteria bacterium]
MPEEPAGGVYGAPRPAVPQRVPLTPRFGGCASGAGVGLGAEQGAGYRRLPEWLKVKLPGTGEYAETRSLLRGLKLHTVCEEARCPNLGHCWERGTATIMILGELCTRRCGFCAVAPGRPNGFVDHDEPRRVGEAVAAMALRHTVITSVARDDLVDGGSRIFAAVIGEIRRRSSTVIEVLVPDFRGHADDLKRVIDAGPEVINHNIETVERLHPTVRPSARYDRSLELLRRVKDSGAPIKAKSGIMLGLGEKDDEIEQVLRDLVAHGCDLLTIGQYLRPTPHHLPVAEYVHPDRFRDWGRRAEALGFENCASGPLVRSSFHADELAGTVRRGESSKAV